MNTGVDVLLSSVVVLINELQQYMMRIFSLWFIMFHPSFVTKDVTSKKRRGDGKSYCGGGVNIKKPAARVAHAHDPAKVHYTLQQWYILTCSKS